MSTLEERLKELSPEDREKVDKRTNELMAEDVVFQRLRKAYQQAQKKTNDPQQLLHALRAEIEQMGGTLSLTAEFPDMPPVDIPDFLDDLK